MFVCWVNLVYIAVVTLFNMLVYMFLQEGRKFWMANVKKYVQNVYCTRKLAVIENLTPLSNVCNMHVICNELQMNVVIFGHGLRLIIILFKTFTVNFVYKKGCLNNFIQNLFCTKSYVDIWYSDFNVKDSFKILPSLQNHFHLM